MKYTGRPGIQTLTFEAILRYAGHGTETIRDATDVRFLSDPEHPVLYVNRGMRAKGRVGTNGLFRSAFNKMRYQSR